MYGEETRNAVGTEAADHPRRGDVPADCDAPRPRRGRPMSTERSDQIIRHAADLLQEVGYERLRMSDVADRAGVGLSTIYRRWPTKHHLAHAALECVTLPFDLPCTGNPRADVHAVLAALAADMTKRDARGVAGFLRCVTEDTEMGDKWRRATTMKIELYLRERLAAALGDDHPEIELRAQAGPAILFYQAFVARQAFDPDTIAGQLTDALLAPGLTGGAVAPGTVIRPGRVKRPRQTAR